MKGGQLEGLRAGDKCCGSKSNGHARSEPLSRQRSRPYDSPNNLGIEFVRCLDNEWEPNDGFTNKLNRSKDSSRRSQPFELVSRRRHTPTM